MYPVLIGIAIGAIAMGRTKPKTRHIKRQVIGSRTGVIYNADEFPELGLLIVHGPASKAVFQRGGEQGRIGWSLYRAIGDARAISVMRLDFEGFLPAHGEGS